MSTSKTVQGSLETLHRLRVRKVRAPQEVLDNVQFLQEKGVNLKTKLGDDYWAFLEQLAAASMDLGRDDIAEDCLNQLQERFPDSPRVQVLYGMRREAAGDLMGALKLYDAILEVDEAHVGIWKRRVAVYRQLGDTKRAVEDLCHLLDTFYTDVEGWLELADLYASRYEYMSSLQALSHAMLLAPQNPFYVLQFAETAATAGKWVLSLKMFLRVVEMVELPVDEQEGDGNGVVRRAWIGVKLSTRKLLTGAVMAPVPSNDSSKKINTSSEGEEETPKEETLRKLDELATERIGALSGTVGKASPSSSPVSKSAGYGVMMRWLSGGN